LQRPQSVFVGRVLFFGRGTDQAQIVLLGNKAGAAAATASAMP